MTQVYLKKAKLLFSNNRVTILCFLSAIITWPIIAEMELFEAFYEFSRDHEDWDLDEFAMLIVNLSIALCISLVALQRKLKRSIFEGQSQRDRAERIARHDPLTGLLNRRAFEAEVVAIHAERTGGPQLGIAMFDLDRFKPINDIYGHGVGDTALVKFAERLQNEFANEVAIARLGGDEFAAVFELPDGPEGAERAARAVLKASSDAIEHSDGQFHLSCSIGLTLWPEKSSFSEALRRADKALYKAKHLGRDQFSWYDPELDERSKNRAEIENDLRSAIQNSEIEPWFQPIIDLRGNKLVGFEVLARWQHKSRGQVSPGVFIPIAEESGLVNKLGLKLLQRACVTAATWDERLSISVNLSPHQFHDPMLVQNIKRILEKTGFNPARLVIEVTEGAVIKDFEEARLKLDALRDLGVAIALDDFGTGYSSLASLRQLPFDRLKIDRSFVTNIEADPQNQKIVSAIMALGHGLHLDITAEGIETQSDLSYLRHLDCHLGQGFLFEKALPADKIEELLMTRWGASLGEPSLTESDETSAAE